MDALDGDPRSSFTGSVDSCLWKFCPFLALAFRMDRRLQWQRGALAKYSGRRYQNVRSSLCTPEIRCGLTVADHDICSRRTAASTACAQTQSNTPRSAIALRYVCESMWMLASVDVYLAEGPTSREASYEAGTTDTIRSLRPL
jgi:hypothetical protein